MYKFVCHELEFFEECWYFWLPFQTNFKRTFWLNIVKCANFKPLKVFNYNVLQYTFISKDVPNHSKGKHLSLIGTVLHISLSSLFFYNPYIKHRLLNSSKYFAVKVSSVWMYISPRCVTRSRWNQISRTFFKPG